MSKKSIDMYNAISSLPDELITPAIYQAGIKEANIKILDILPEEYMTEENINFVLDNQENKYSWHTFSLAAIPETARTQKVCDIAVSKSLSNFSLVPEEMRSNAMLQQIVYRAESFIHLLPLFPVGLWDIEAVYTGVKTIYNYGENSNYNSRYYSHNNSDKKKQLRLIQIFLSYVPVELINHLFYLGLFETSISLRDIDVLTPQKYKTIDYYTKVGERNIKEVPTEKLTFGVLKAALSSGKNHIYSFTEEDSTIREKLWKVMNDEIADIIIQNSPAKLSGLPNKFHTKSRLILALSVNKSNNTKAKEICGKFDMSKFDTDICKAIVSRDEYGCPDLPDHIWSEEFISYCMEHAKNYYWYEKMPVEHQTQQLVDIILNSTIGYIEYTREEFITYDLAVKAYQCQTSTWGDDNYEYRKYVPKHYLEDFQIQTGLPLPFFGQEKTYLQVRENRGNYTYCQIGESYVGFFIDKDGRDTYNRLIMTRRSPMSFKPSIVFNRIIQTFHVSWFEKMIADNDPQYILPAPPKGLKGKQRNKYMGVTCINTINEKKVYGHSLMGTNVIFTSDNYEESSFNLIINHLEKDKNIYEIAS